MGIVIHQELAVDKKYEEDRLRRSQVVSPGALAPGMRQCALESPGRGDIKTTYQIDLAPAGATQAKGNTIQGLSPLATRRCPYRGKSRSNFLETTNLPTKIPEEPIPVPFSASQFTAKSDKSRDLEKRQLVFPGAEGYGRFAKGGRGGA